jgi:hypothetical protein
MTNTGITKETVELLHIAAASVPTPSTGQIVQFYDTSNSDHLSVKNDAGTVTDIQAGGGGGAPTTATYITQTPDGTLSNEQAMSLLATGIVKNTTATGVQSIAVAGTDYTSPTGTENLSNKTITASSLIATALSLLIGGFKAIFTHANTADRTYTFQNVSGTVQLSSDGNIIQDSSFEVWERGIAAAPDGWVVTGASATVAQEATLIKHGIYSAKLTRAGTDCHLSQDVYALAGKTYVQGRTYTFSAWVYATVASRVRLRANDGTTTTNSSYHSGGSTWEYLTCSFTVAGGATALNVGLAVDTGNTSGYIDAAALEEGLSQPNYTPAIREFNQFPRRACMWHDEATVKAGNALLTIISISQSYALYVFQNTAAQNDAFTHSFWLAAGTYTFYALGVTATSAGQITWYIDDVIVISNQEWYIASPAFNVTKSASVTVYGDGEHILKGVVASKNASSSGYNINLTKYYFRPSSD